MTHHLAISQEYYDKHTHRKIRDFIKGNARVSSAWSTLERFAPSSPREILEIGCGIGSVCWKMSQKWPEAVVTGIDISSKSINAARQLFAAQNVRFYANAPEFGRHLGNFDLIVLMDVYEHISIQDRPSLHCTLRESISDLGRIFLSIPTPAHLHWLKTHKPDQIQPIDEDINIETILTLANETETVVICYKEVNVWKERDYAHIVLGPQNEVAFAKSPRVASKKGRNIVRSLIRRMFPKKQTPLLSESGRRAYVRERLGEDVLKEALA